LTDMRLLFQNVVFAALTVLYSTSHSQEVTCQVEKLADWGVNDAGLPTPRPDALDLKTIDPKVIAPYFNEQVKFRAAIVRGDFAEAQGFWDRLIAEPDPSSRMRQLKAMHFAMEGKGLYFLSYAQAWLTAQTNSLPAKVFLGLAYSDAAYTARGRQYTGQTPRNAMIIFKQRITKAQEILEPLLARKDVYGWSANSSLSLGYFYQGMDEKGWRTQEELINAAPSYGFSYFWAAAYAESIWAKPDIATRRAARLRALSASNKLPQSENLVLEQELNYRLRGLARTGNPQEARPYWTQRNKEAPHLFNTLGWLMYERSVENWPEVLRLADLAISANPLQTYSYTQRATANKAMARVDTVFKDTLAAAVLGNDSAMSDLIQGHVRGTLGFAPGNFNQMYAYCNMGATFGMPAAANCMGSAYTEGFAGIKRDDRSAIAWHMFAARGGISNSQHDIGVILPRVSKLPEAQSISQHWMREAARQQHPYAIQKATKEPEPEVDTECAAKLARDAALSKVKQIFKP
jgi:hypothetical protein